LQEVRHFRRPQPTCGTLTITWTQSYEAESLNIKVNTVEIGPELVGANLRLRITSGIKKKKN
jgi:hypothetical protein